jgi:hypothetical protein
MCEQSESIVNGKRKEGRKDGRKEEMGMETKVSTF